jgi:hypothetical protein
MLLSSCKIADERERSGIPPQPGILNTVSCHGTERIQEVLCANQMQYFRKLDQKGPPGSGRAKSGKLRNQLPGLDVSRFTCSCIRFNSSFNSQPISGKVSSGKSRFLTARKSSVTALLFAMLSQRLSDTSKIRLGMIGPPRASRAPAIPAQAFKFRILFGDADVRCGKALLKVGDVQQYRFKPFAPQWAH